MTSLGVFAGANTTYHALISKPGKPASIMVGTSGASGERLALVTARALSAPDLTCGSDVLMVSNIIDTWPPSRSFSAGALPL